MCLWLTRCSLFLNWKLRSQCGSKNHTNMFRLHFVREWARGVSWLALKLPHSKVSINLLTNIHRYFMKKKCEEDTLELLTW